jgi:hypothetical protein
MNKRIGKCSLCLSTDVHLQDSHYLSKGIYRALRSNKDNNNPNPYHITENSAVRSSKQFKAYLLCSNCEQNLNKNGENWVLKHCLMRKGESLLINQITKLSPDHEEEDGTIYFSSNYPDIINIRDLTYFAISIFWRASIYPWNDDKTIPVKLGPYGEVFRQYLMLEKPFPSNTALSIILRKKSKISGLTYFPIGSNFNGYHLYQFVIPGLAFILYVGNKVPKHCQDFCFVNGKGNPIFLPTQFDDILKDEVSEFFAKHLKNKASPRRV